MPIILLYCAYIEYSKLIVKCSLIVAKVKVFNNLNNINIYINIHLDC